jgi:hypothetical protein
MHYTVSQTFYFRELRQSVRAGSTVELDDALAHKYLKSHPGLLKATRQTAQGSASAVRTKAPVTESATVSEAPAPKKRGRRK